MSVAHGNLDRQREALSAYLDGELAPEEREALEAHLSDCADCQAELGRLRQARALLRALPPVASPRSFAISREQSARIRPAAPPVWTRAAQWIGSVAAVAGLTLLIGTNLPHAAHLSSTAGSATSAAPYSGHAAGTTTGPGVSSQVTGADQHATATSRPAPTTTSTPSGGGAQTPPAPSVTPASAQSPWPETGVVLLVGGATAAAAGTLRRRRAHLQAG